MRIKLKKYLLPLFFVAAVLSSCEEAATEHEYWELPSSAPPPRAVPVEGVSLASDTTLSAGHRITLAAVIEPAEASNKALNWESDNEAVATVDANGRVTAVNEGTATITVTTVDGEFEATCTVTVELIDIIGITLVLDKDELDEDAEIIIEPDAELSLAVTLEPANGSFGTMIWTSDNEAVATVDENGNVTAAGGYGTANITLTIDGEFMDEEFIATFTVHVPAPITILIPSMTLYLGDEIALSVTIEPEDAEWEEIIWESDAENVVTIDADGKITAVGVGEADIIVTVVTVNEEEFTAVCKITVVMD